MNRPTVVLWMSCLAFAAAPVWSAGKAHEHGALKLDVAIEGNKLTIAAEVRARLRSPTQGKALFSADAAAQCTLSKAEVNAPVIEPGAKPATKDEHADLDASYEFSCAQPAELRSLDVGLFDAYKRLQRIDVQVAGAKSQSKVTLKRPARSVKLVR